MKTIPRNRSEIMEEAFLGQIITEVSKFLTISPSSIALCVMAIATVCLLIRESRSKCCYLVCYSCYKPPDERKMGTELSEYVIRKSNPQADSLRFQVNVHIKSGLGQNTYAPNSFFQEGDDACSMSEGWVEMQEAFTATLDNLFDSAGIRPSDVDILVVNVCCFAPMPSLSAWIVKKYNMRENVKAYNISGMGCSAGVIAISLARDLLRVHKNSYAVVVGTENLTMNRYDGNDKSMMMSNCLFRLGGSGVLLSNKASDRGRAKMKLLHLVRTHVGQNDQAYNSIVQREDDDNLIGVSLSTYLIEAAAMALKNNITTLAPKVLPLTEQLYFVYNMLRIKILKSSIKPYVPNFRLAFEHFCIHPGGRAVINGIGKSLNLTDYDTEPAHMTLHRFGNTSASGLWYEMAYIEAKGRMKKGDRIWQIALGSGFKCNTVVWKVLRNIDPKNEYNVWNDCIHDYPCNTRNPFELEYKQRFNLPSKQS